MNESIFEALKNFLVKDYGIRRARMNLNSRIEEDLGITGLDASEMLVAFGKKFDVDVFQFKFDEYFNPEGTSWFQPTHTSNKKTLTISDLVKAIIAGKLDEQVINS